MRRWALFRKKRSSTQRADESVEVDDERVRAEEAAEERRRQYGQERVQMALSRGDFDAIAWMAARYTAETTYEHRYASDALRESGAQGVDAMIKVLDREGFNDYLVDLLIEADDPRAVPVFKKALSSPRLSAYGSHWRRKIEDHVSRFDPEARKAVEQRAQEAERREQAKQDQLQRARDEVRGYDEATMLEQLRRVCRAYSSALSGDDQEIDELEAVATAIGERLNSIGGIQKMREVFYLLAGIPGARTLEMHWSGIGDWRG